MLSDEQIKAFEDKGFRRWTNYGKDRLYAKAWALGLRTEKYNTGNIRFASLNGEHVSNCAARRMIQAKLYVDIKTGELVCDNSDLKEAGQIVYDEVMGA